MTGNNRSFNSESSKKVNLTNSLFELLVLTISIFTNLSYKTLKITGKMPGSQGLLPAPSPLRTLRETFTSQGSSIGKASCDTQQSETAFTVRGCIRGTFSSPYGRQ